MPQHRIKKTLQSSVTDTVPEPIEFRNLKRRVASREPLTSVPDRPVELSFVVAGADAVRVRSVSSLLEGAHVLNGGKAYKVDLSIAGAVWGRHAFPPSVQLKKFVSGRQVEFVDEARLTGYLPDHLALRPLPDRLAKELRVPRRVDAGRFKLVKGKNQATTVFAPDDRFTFSDTSFPWCTAGRVDTANGSGSGVMIGPRHLLTVSHIIVWNNNNTAGWIKFTPSFF